MSLGCPKSTPRQSLRAGSNLDGPASVGGDPIVLYFHHVGKRVDHYTSLSSVEFVNALDIIEEIAPVVPLAPVATCRAGFAITFDDGYAETIDTALPLLEERGLTCALFVNTATIGRRLDGPGRRTSSAATWRDLSVALASGHLVGSHGHRHVSWEAIGGDAIGEEVQQSFAMIFDHLGVSPFAVAYPYGRRPTRLPAGLEDHDYYTTARAPAAHHSCRRHAIRRVYLPSARPDSWERLLRSWHEQRRADCVCCHSDTRTLGRAEVDAGDLDVSPPADSVRGPRRL